MPGAGFGGVDLAELAVELCPKALGQALVALRRGVVFGLGGLPAEHRPGADERVELSLADADPAPHAHGRQRALVDPLWTIACRVSLEAVGRVLVGEEADKCFDAECVAVGAD